MPPVAVVGRLILAELAAIGAPVKRALAVRAHDVLLVWILVVMDALGDEVLRRRPAHYRDFAILLGNAQLPLVCFVEQLDGYQAVKLALDRLALCHCQRFPAAHKHHQFLSSG